MKHHYLRVARELAEWMKRLDNAVERADLPELHRIVVDLKNTLPETSAYENSPLLLDGLRVHRPEDIPTYALRLRERIDVLRREYLHKADGQQV